MVSDVVIFDDLSGYHSEVIEEVVAMARSTEVHSERTVKFVAQYVPAAGARWTDLSEDENEEDAALVVDLNIDKWNEMPLGSQLQRHRPSRYRIIERVVTEKVVLEMTDSWGVKPL